MKKFVLPLVTLVVGGLLVWLLLPARLPNHVKPAVPNSFAEVAAKLDSGGEVYAYLSTERMIQSATDLVSKILKASSAEKAPQGAELQKVMALLGKLGMNEISGVGLSAVSLPGGLSRTKMVLHHFPDQNQGLIWQLMGNRPRPLEELKLLPQDTVVAAFGDYHLEPLWQFLKKELGAAGQPTAQGVNSVEPMLAMQGIQLDKLLKSLSGSMGYLVTLDPQKTITLPAGDTPLTIPEPSMAIVLAVRDSTLFDLLKAKLPPQIARYAEQKNKRSLHFTHFKLPVPFDPMIVQVDGFLIAASTQVLAEAMLTAREKGNGLTGQGEYKQLAAPLPGKGNGFQYMGSRLWKVYAGILERVMADKTASAGDTEMMRTVTALIPADMRMLGILQNDRDGSVYTAVCNLRPELIVALPVVGALGVVAAIAIPNFVTATEKAKQKKAMGDLRTISTALEAYLTDHGTLPRGKTLAELKTSLEPMYIKTLPGQDPWGHDYLYRQISTSEFALASGGKDGVFLGWEQSGTFPGNRPEEDLICTSQGFAYCPEGTR